MSAPVAAFERPRPGLNTVLWPFPVWLPRKFLELEGKV